MTGKFMGQQQVAQHRAGRAVTGSMMVAKATQHVL